MTQNNNILHRLGILLFLLALCLLLTGPVFAADNNGVVNVAKANLREGAGTDYPLVFQLDLNQKVVIQDSKDGWLLVESSKGKGWIAAWLVDMPHLGVSARVATVDENVVNIRKEPNIQSAKVTQVKKGDKLELVDQDGEWFQIKTKNGQKGWVAGWLLKLNVYSLDSKTPEITTPPVEKPAKPGEQIEKEPGKSILVTADIVNIREGPSISYPIVAKVNGGMELKVISQQGDWLKISLNDTKVGWIAQWLTIPKTNQSESQTDKPVNEYSLQLDNNKIVSFIDLGDKLQISLPGISNDQYQIGQTSDGVKLIIEIKAGEDFKSLSKKIDNWGIEEIKVEKKAIIISFKKNFQYQTKYNQNTNASEVEVIYSSAQLVPVKQIKFNPMENQAVLQIASARKIEYSTQNSEPNRIVIDLPQSSLQLNSNDELEQRASFGPIRKVSSRQLSPDMVRVEAELIPGSLYQVSQQDDYIVIGAKMIAGTSLKGKLIVLDPGHGSIQPGGWTDPGTSGKKSGVAERDINLAITLKVRDLLLSEGANVVLTHSTGRTYLSLAGRAAIANDLNADIYVSIHCNAHNNLAIQGSMTFFYAPTWHSELSSQRWLRQRLASSIQEELVRYAGRPNQGIKEESYAVLRETRVPSVLVETAFLSNATEETLLNTDGFRSKVAQGIFKGIERYFQGF